MDNPFFVEDIGNPYKNYLKMDLEFLGFLALMERKILCQKKCIFSWRKRTTNGSSFFDWENNNFLATIGMTAGFSFDKK